MRLRAPHHATLTNEPLVERGPRGIDASRLLHNPPLSAVLHGIQVRFTEKKQTIRSGTAVPAVSVLHGSMRKAKRSGSVAKSNLGVG